MGRKMNMKNEKKIKVLVADNSEFARNNLKKFLENNEKIQLLNCRGFKSPSDHHELYKPDGESHRACCFLDLLLESCIPGFIFPNPLPGPALSLLFRVGKLSC